MLTFTSSIFFAILCILLFYNLAKPLFAGDKSLIWSPITMISITLIYYVVWPVVKGLENNEIENVQSQSLFFITAVLFFISILIGFRETKTGSFPKWNAYFDVENILRCSLVLFIIALVCYIPFRGFRYTINAADAGAIAARTGFVSYFVDAISILVAASCLSLVGLKNKGTMKNKAIIVASVILYFTLVMYIVAGFRTRLVTLLLAIATVYHCYPLPRKINWKVFVPIGVSFFLLFAIMDTARSYGSGLNMEVAKSISFQEATQGAGECESVLSFSILATDYCYRNNIRYGFEPIIFAICMPLPRTLFPWKPQGGYLTDIQIQIRGKTMGEAILAFTESYMAFGLIGVILYGLFIGWLSKKFWNNYINNKNSIGAILLLALFNGFCYPLISRGYMAAAFNEFMYYVILPFWLIALFKQNKKQI